ncbi:hypothetical protein EMCRGX_G027418 [Ephydatia muelleri]
MNRSPQSIPNRRRKCCHCNGVNARSCRQTSQACAYQSSMRLMVQSVQTAVSLAREELLSKACQTLTSSGLAPDNNTTWNLLHGLKAPKGTPPTPPTAPLLVAPYLPPDFNIMAVLHSFSKDTAAEVPLQFPICAVLKEVVNMLISGKVPVQVARAAPMVSMVLWATSRFVALFGYYFFRNRCTTRARCSHCSGSRHHPSEPPLGLNINIAKCELFSSRDLSSFPEEMRRSNVPHFEILGAPIGDLVFCAKFVAQKQSEASKLLKELEAKVLSSKIEDQQFNNLFHNASVTDRARLLSISSPHASAWLSVTPSPQLNLHLEPAEFQVALKWWLDVLVPNWDLGKPAAFDLSVTSTLQSSALLETSVTAGSAALLTENRKHNNSDKKCDELGWACIPLVVETYGCWGG